MSKVYLFGAGHVAEDELKSNLVVEAVFDNNPDMHGTEFLGFAVQSPENIPNLSEGDKIIICTTSIAEVKTQLIELGIPSEAIIASSCLDEHEQIAELDSYRFDGFISSGLPSSPAGGASGGIFRVTERDSGLDITNLYEGSTHGLVMTEEGNLLFTSPGDGLVEMRQNGEIVQTVPIPAGLRPHGVRCHGDRYYVICSLDDSILVLDKSGQIENKIKISNKMDYYPTPQHHCNDLFVSDSHIYVSMFSISGNWKRGRFDGGVLEMAHNGNEKVVIKNDLSMPHNVVLYRDQIMVLNSFKGEILLNNFELFGTLPGFVRGLDINEEYIIVGESRNRNFSRMNTGRKPVSIDSRVTIINRKYGFCRSLSLPRSISEVHSVCFLH